MGIALLVARGAQAQPDDVKRAVVAQALFAKAQQEMKEASYAAACPKLEEAAQLAPESYAVRMALGDCYLALGRTASAWITYTRAMTLARDAQKQKEAMKRAQDLEARLAHLTIRVPESARRLPDLQVRRDDLAVGPGQWDVAMPVDRGPHLIVATAPGKRPWLQTVEVQADGMDQSVTLGDLEDAAPAPPPPPLRPPISMDVTFRMGVVVRLSPVKGITERSALTLAGGAFVSPTPLVAIGLLFERVNLGEEYGGSVRRDLDTLWLGVRLHAIDTDRVRLSALFAPALSWQAVSEVNDMQGTLCAGTGGPYAALRAGVGLDLRLGGGASFVLDTAVDHIRLPDWVKASCSTASAPLAMRHVISPGPMTLFGGRAGFAYRFDGVASPGR